MLNEYENDIVFAKYITYMKKALLHKRIDYIRHQDFLNKKEQNLTQEEWVVLSMDDNTAHSSFFCLCEDNDIDNELLEKAVTTLTEKQRKVIYLNINKKMTLNRIGNELHITTNAVEKIKMRAIARLRKYLEDFK